MPTDDAAILSKERSTPTASPELLVADALPPMNTEPPVMSAVEPEN
jgi:hypothetical protein